MNSLNRVKLFLLKQNIGLLLLFVIFCFMYILNCMTPLLSDDYFISFVWPEGMRINGILPEDAKKVSGFSDVFDSLKAYYFIWGGRIPGQTLMTLSAWWGKDFFNVVNSFMTVLLIMEIYWISHEGKVSFEFNYKYVFWIFFALWSFNTSFVDTFMWLSGSCEYLWMMVLLLAFLIPYIQNYYDANKHNKDTFIFTSGMFILGTIAGCSREMLICWIILVMIYWLWLCKKENRLYAWQLFGLIGLSIGYCILILAPGNFARLASDSHTDSVFLIDVPMLIYKIFFISIIFVFHFILWHFIISFFNRQRNNKEKIMAHNLAAYKNVIIAKVSALIALGTMVLLFFIMYSGARPSFVTLVFLIISVSSVFRASELSGVTVIRETVRKILQTVGLLFFIITVVLSVQWNYVNRRQWDNILQNTKNDNNNPVLLEMESTPYLPEITKLIGIINMNLSNSAEIWYGAHVIDMPVFFEGCYYNIIIPQYYGIKRNGIIHNHN